MKYEYKFVKVKASQKNTEIEFIINNLAREGWRMLNFHPTNDPELSKKGVYAGKETLHVGYVFVFEKAIE